MGLRTFAAVVRNDIQPAKSSRASCTIPKVNRRNSVMMG
jgi:hypothetical protein